MSSERQRRKEKIKGGQRRKEKIKGGQRWKGENKRRAEVEGRGEVGEDWRGGSGRKRVKAVDKLLRSLRAPAARRLRRLRRGGELGRGGDVRSGEHSVGDTKLWRVSIETRIQPPYARDHLNQIIFPLLPHGLSSLVAPLLTILAPAARSSCDVAQPPSGKFARGELTAARGVSRHQPGGGGGDERGQSHGSQGNNRPGELLLFVHRLSEVSPADLLAARQLSQRDTNSRRPEGLVF
eukprot:768423-Hanusia_phi.AAC.4